MLERHAKKHIDTILFPSKKDYNVIRGKYTKMAYGRLGKDWQNAEDAVQSTYLKLLEFKPSSSFSEDNYEKLFTVILFNHIQNMKRNEHSLEVNNIQDDGKFFQYLEISTFDEDDGSDFIAVASQDASPAQAAQIVETIASVEREIYKLKGNSRKVATLSSLYGYKPIEIAGMTGIKHGTVRQIVIRFREHLKEVL